MLLDHAAFPLYFAGLGSERPSRYKNRHSRKYYKTQYADGGVLGLEPLMSKIAYKTEEKWPRNVFWDAFWALYTVKYSKRILYLSIYLSIYISSYLSIYQYLFLFPSLSPSFHSWPSQHISEVVSISPSIFPPFSLSLSLYRRPKSKARP